MNGDGAHPLYKFLRARQPLSVPSSSRPSRDGAIEWNYTKFIVDREGIPRKRYGPAFDPLQFEDDVRLILAGKDPLPSECLLHPGRKVCKVRL